MDGETGAQIILIITSLRLALWPSTAEQVQLWRLVSVLFIATQVCLPGDKMAAA